MEIQPEFKPQAATLIVAASDSLHSERADYYCDGTDDDVTIQAAIDALPSTGGMVLLLDGTFNITSTIDLSGLKHITLAGLGTSSIINNQNAAGDHAIKADNAVTDTPSSVRYITIKDMLIKGNANSGHGLFFDYCDVLTINNIVSVENGDHGLYITNNAWTVAADVAYADLIISNSRFLTNGRSGIYLSDVHDLLISSLNLEENNDYGIELGSNCYDLSLNNCNIEDNVDGEIYVAGLLRSAYINSNTIEASTDKSGIKIIGSTDRLVIVGNTFDSGGRAIEIRSGSLSVDGMVISNNSFSGQSISAMSLGTLGDSFLNVVIEGNTVAYNGYSTAYGIFANYMDVLNICNNSLTTKGASIALSNCTHCIVSNNSISAERIGAGNNEHEGFKLLSCGNVIIEGNIIQKETATALDEGINLLTIAGNHKIVNNNISGATTPISGLTNDCIAHDRYSDLLMDVLAVSATHVRSNEDLSAATPITFTLDAQPDVPRTLSWSFDSHAQITAYDMEVIGIDTKGNTIIETWDETAGWSGETSNAFATITSIKMTTRTGTGAADTMDIGITDVIGLSNIIYETSDVFKIKKNNANVTVSTAQVNTTYDTYDMSVITLGVGDDFTIWYKSNLNIIS